MGVDGGICRKYGIHRDFRTAALIGVPAVEAVTAASGGVGQRGQLLVGGGHAADRGRTAVAVKGDDELGGRRHVLLEDCLDIHVGTRHEEIIVFDGHAAADDLPLLEVVAGVGRSGQANLRACHGFVRRCGSCAVSIRFHGDGKLGGCRRCVLLEDGLDLHVVVRHEELIVLDGHAAADDLPLLEVVALFGHGGQGDLRAGRSGGRSCGTSAVSVIADGDGVGGGGNNAVLPQCFDLNIPVHGVGISHLVLCAANLPSLELLIGGSGEAALGQDVICPCLDGHGPHAAAAAVAVKGDGTVSKRRTLAHSDLRICAGKVVVVLRVAHEVIAGRQVLNLRAAARRIAAFACHTVFHLVSHAGDLAVAATLGGGRDTDQAVRRFLCGFADAPRRGYGVGAAVRPFSRFGCDANDVVARIRGGIACDVHCGGIIAAHGCCMLGAIVGVGSGDADAGLGGIGRRRRCVLLEDGLDLHIAVRHGELVVHDGHIAADDLPLLEVIALVWCGGQSDLRSSHGLVRRCGSRAVAVRFHGDGKLGRCRHVLLEDCLDLYIAVRHGELVVGDYKSRRRFDLPFLKVVALVGRCAQSDLRTGRSLCGRGGSRSAALCGHGDGMLSRRVFAYRNRQFLRIAARAVGSLDGEAGGSLRSGCAADLAGGFFQRQALGQLATNAPCDRLGAGGGQNLAVRLAHLAVRQGVRGDGHAMAAGSKLRRQLAYIRRNVISRFVELAIAAKPLKVVVGISVGAGQTFGRRRGKALAGFHNDLDSIRASSQFSAAKVKGNGFQPVRAQRAGVQDFKDGAETEEREGERSIGAGICAGQIVLAANHTVR